VLTSSKQQRHPESPAVKKKVSDFSRLLCFIVVCRLRWSHNMTWSEITREQYRRDGLRYASDTTDDEWTVIEPLARAQRQVVRVSGIRPHH
jgi:hypothetical protein